MSENNTQTTNELIIDSLLQQLSQYRNELLMKNQFDSTDIAVNIKAILTKKDIVNGIVDDTEVDAVIYGNHQIDPEFVLLKKDINKFKSITFFEIIKN